jgi:hypothetical protein
MGHFPLNQLALGRPELVHALARPGVVGYVSAHDHTEAAFCRDPANEGLVELNIGSVLDWPMEFGFLDVRTDPSKSFLAYDKHTVGGDITDSPSSPLRCDPALRQEDEVYTGYCESLCGHGLGFHSGCSSDSACYFRLLAEGVSRGISASGAAPPRGTDGQEARETAQAFMRAAEGRSTSMKNHTLCEAWWASRAEHTQASAPPRTPIYADAPACDAGAEKIVLTSWQGAAFVRTR